MELKDKVAVVTGGAHGIGRAMVERFVAEGARGIVIVDRDSKASLQLATALGDGTIGMGGDVSCQADVVSAVRTAEDHFGPIDLMVSNAGILTAQGIDAPDEVWKAHWDVNVMAHVHAARAVVPAMVARGQGYLLSTASAAGLLTQIGDAPYSVTKHAAVALAEWLSITYGDQGIKVSCLCPQGVNTDLLRAAAASSGGGVLIAQGVIEPQAVADAVVAGLAEERFLILPHPEVDEYLQRRATDRDRWLTGMRRLQRRMRDTSA